MECSSKPTFTFWGSERTKQFSIVLEMIALQVQQRKDLLSVLSFVAPQLRSGAKFAALIASLALVCLAAPAVGVIPTEQAQAKTIRSNHVIAPTGSCMIRTGGGIGCFSSTIALRRGASGYFWMLPRGRARVAWTRDSFFRGRRTPEPVHMDRGDRWVKRGVVCVLRAQLRCQNRSGRGFLISEYRVRRW